MKKTTILDFINKYALGGAVEAVTWNVTKKRLNTQFLSEDKSLYGDITLSEFDFEDSELHIYDTSKLKTLLGVVGEDVDLTTVTENNKVISLTIKDSHTDINFMLADSTAIPSVPKLKNIPDFDVEIPLSKEFIGKFVKAKSALNEVDTFTLVMNKKKKKLELVLGYASNINSNRISLDINPKTGKDKLDNPISFNAKYLKEILIANSAASDATLMVSSAGLAFVQFSIDNFTSQYYLVQIELSN